MSRGDKRERDREKNQKKLQDKARQEARGGNPLQRNMDDAAKLQAKVAAKKAKEQDSQSQCTATVGSTVAGKKVPAKKKDNLDDLLGAGLATKKRVK